VSLPQRTLRKVDFDLMITVDSLPISVVYYYIICIVVFFSDKQCYTGVQSCDENGSAVYLKSTGASAADRRRKDAGFSQTVRFFASF